jgi:Smg protein
LRERVLAIVSLIAQYFLEEHDGMSENDLVEELLSVGFDADEIDAAFNWMETQALGSPEPADLVNPVNTFRIFSVQECLVLSPEARGFLARLRTMGVLNDELQEEVIQRAMDVAEDEICLKEIKTITILALFARSQNEWRREFDCLLEDDWSRMLN